MNNDAIDTTFRETGTALAIPDDLAPPSVPDARRVLSLDEVRGLGETFYQSGMFKDVRSAAQAVVKIIAGQELGIGPMSAMTQIQIVEGKPTLTAPAIGGRVKASGRYDYRILEHTEQVCHLRFFERGVEIGESRFTMDDAKAAGLAGTDVWKKYPRNMLFARAMTNGARWYCADVFNGAVYTAEELGGLPPIADDPPKPVAAPPTTDKQPSALDALQARWLEANPGGDFPAWCRAERENGAKTIGELVRRFNAAPPSDETPPEGDEGDDAPMSAKQKGMIFALHSELGHDDAERHAVYMRIAHVTSASYLSKRMAGLVIDDLNAALDAKNAAP